MPVRAPAGAVELPALRNLRSKVFDLGNGRRRVSVGMEILHVPQDVDAWVQGGPVVWEEIDERPVFDPGKNKFVVTRAWYTLEVDPDRFFAVYTSRITGQRVTVELRRLNGISLASATFKAEVRGSDVVFPDVRPGLDLMIRTYKGGIETFKKIKGPQAPRSFEWEFTEADAGPTSIAFATRGLDNADLVDAMRAALPRKRRAVQMQTNLVSARRGQQRVHTYTETWTGKTLFLENARTRVQTVRDDVVYPVLVDATLQETIVANNDDGTDSTNANTWTALQHYYYGGMNYALGEANRNQTGWRFQSVTGPASGDTINAATLTFHVNKVGAGGNTATIYGFATDSAAAWSNTVRPEVVAKTTASASQALTTTGTKVVTVTSIFQEIVNRAGWASGNNVSFFIDGGSGEGESWIDEIDATLNDAIVFDAEYTAGGATTEEGAISEAASAAASFSVVVTAPVSLTAAASPAAALSAVASVVASLSAAASAADTHGGPATVPAAMTAAGAGDAAFAALAQVAAAILEGASAGETWTARAQALAALVANGAAAATISAAAGDLEQAAIAEGTTAAASFLAGAQVLGAFTAAASAAAALTAAANVVVSIAQAANAQATFSAQTVGVDYLVVGAITIRAALSARVTLTPALSGEVAIEPALAGELSIKPN